MRRIAQGGLDACHLAFYTDEDIENDKVWDNWRLEGPPFVWHFRGAPHVHVWVNIADSSDVQFNAPGVEAADAVVDPVAAEAKITRCSCDHFWH